MRAYGCVVEFVHILKPEQRYEEGKRLELMLNDIRVMIPPHLQLRTLEAMKDDPPSRIMERYIIQIFYPHSRFHPTPKVLGHKTTRRQNHLLLLTKKLYSLVDVTTRASSHDASRFSTRRLSGNNEMVSFLYHKPRFFTCCYDSLFGSYEFSESKWCSWGRKAICYQEVQRNLDRGY